MRIPFLDLKAHHEPLRAEIQAAINRVIDANAFAGGPFVAEFETAFANFCGAKHAVGVGNGTDALWLSLLALGVGPGDEVITVPATFMATAEAVSFCGARPVFVDIDEQTYTMDPERLEQAITPRTRAIIPVHLFGQMADMDCILEIAARRGIPVVEDACQAHGAEHRGRKAGTLGVAGCFSFYPGKNLGAFGEAGGIVTDDEVLKSKLHVLRDHGQARKYFHSVVGWNARMDGIQGAVLSVKLKGLPAANEARRRHGRRYTELLAGEEHVITPFESPDGTHVYHVYAIRVRDRDAILKAMGDRGIGCGIHYPVPIHLQEAYRSLGYGPGSFPIAEKCANEFLSLPMFPELRPDQIETVVDELKACIRARLDKSHACAA
ncbi:MAG TPA: DegT/DnrJ/EryC1/StrS family aminotransferase [Verrucomicrobiae bacterium]